MSAMGSCSPSEEPVDLFLGHSREIVVDLFLRPGFPFHLGEYASEGLLEFGDSALGLDPDQTQGGAIIEDDRKDDAVGNEAHVEILFLALVEQGRELLLADQGGELARRREIGGRKRRERGGVDPAGIARRGYQLSLAVDEHYDLGVRALQEPIHRVVYRPEILLKDIYTTLH